MKHACASMHKSYPLALPCSSHYQLMTQRVIIGNLASKSNLYVTLFITSPRLQSGMKGFLVGCKLWICLGKGAD